MTYNNKMTIQELHQAILAETSRIIDAQLERKETYGRDLIDLPEDSLILYGIKLPISDDGYRIRSGMTKASAGTIELTMTTEAARPTFEWLAEITVRQPDAVEHYLLRPGETIVETYGKKVFDVAPDRAQMLLDRLEKI